MVQEVNDTQVSKRMKSLAQTVCKYISRLFSMLIIGDLL